MTEPDQYDQKAAELLPCESDCGEIHRVECPVLFRLAVAVELRRLEGKIEKLQYELTVIGDMAVSDWNDAVAGAVGDVVPNPPTNYAQKRREELDCIKELRAENEKLKAELKAEMEMDDGWPDAALKAEAERVTERDQRILQHMLDNRLYIWGEINGSRCRAINCLVAIEAICEAQRKEREGE